MLRAQIVVMNSIQEKPELKLDWATHAAAKYAVENWHYSGVLPSGKLLKIGVYESGVFIGVVIFSRGANNRIGSPYELDQTEVCELTRIALTSHIAPVSKVMAIAIRFLRRQCPGMRLIISFADPEQGHNGGVYQAGNWIYIGKSKAQPELLINGKFVHKRSANAKYGTASPEKITAMTGANVQWSQIFWKYVYLMPLDKKMREQVIGKTKPYPKRSKQAMAGTTGTAAG